MNDLLKSKLAELPREPGVYFFKDAKKRVIYVGKAAVLRNRVRQYFQSSKNHDYKTRMLVAEIADVDWLVVGSEMEALFLEGAMIKRYMTKYNILGRDDKNFLYIRVPIRDKYPVVTFTRRPLDDDARYFGPYTSAWAVRKAMRYLRKVFPYYVNESQVTKSSLDHHLGLSPPTDDKLDVKDYKRCLKQLMLYLEGKGGRVIKELEKEMKQAAARQDFETAAKLRNRILNIRGFAKRHLFGDKEMFDLTRDQALVGLTKLLGLKKIPRRIECYDISHLAGTNNVASMVVFTDGIPNRGEYRKFKMQLLGNDDFGHMREVIKRRFGHWQDWPKPDLLIIDGGKGQLGAALSVLAELGHDVPAVGLAKREEEIIMRRQEGSLPIAGHYQDEAWITGNTEFSSIKLPRTSHTLKLVQHIRDEAHRFAVTYHSVLRRKKITQSLLEEIPGIGPKTRRKLINVFGSLKGVRNAELAQLEAAVGKTKAQVIKKFLA